MKKLHATILVLTLFCLSTQAQVTALAQDFDATAGSNMPSLWSGSATLGTNYGSGNFYADHTSGVGRFAFASNGYFCTELVAAGTYDISFWMRISSSPFENIQLGYCTNQASIASTFTSLQTVNNNSTTWTNYNYTITLPVNSYITWSTAGGAKTHVVDDVSISLTTGINSINTSNFSFEISPNPSKGIVRILQSSTSTILIEIYNSVGRLIYSVATNDEQTTLDLGNEAQGVYIVKLTSDNKNVTSKWMVLE